MQVIGGGTPVDTWSDAEVDQALDSLLAIELATESINTGMNDVLFYQESNLTLLVALLFVGSAIFAYFFSAHFIPSARELFNK